MSQFQWGDWERHYELPALEEEAGWVDTTGDPVVVTERDMAQPSLLDEPLLTDVEWWHEFHANACCPDAGTAARRLCGCGGSAAWPSGASRLLSQEVGW